MAKDPAVLFYTSDFLTGTITMDNDQVGMYIRLLCLQHQKGRLTERDMLKICGTHDDEVFSKFAQDESGYFNKRLDEEVSRRKKYSESRAKNRRGKKKTSPKKISKTYDKHMETETETVTITKNEDKNEKVIYPFDSEKFIEWWGYWKEYKRKEHKFKYASRISEQAAVKGLSGLANGEEATAIKIIEQSIANGWKGFFQLHSEQKKAGGSLDNLKQEILNRNNNG